MSMAWLNEEVAGLLRGYAELTQIVSRTEEEVYARLGLAWR